MIGKISSTTITLFYIILLLGTITTGEAINTEIMNYCYPDSQYPTVHMLSKDNALANLTFTWDSIIEYTDNGSSSLKYDQNDTIVNQAFLKDGEFSAKEKTLTKDKTDVRQFIGSVNLATINITQYTVYDTGTYLDGFMGFNINLSGWNFSSTGNRLALKLKIKSDMTNSEVLYESSANPDGSNSTSSSNSILIHYPVLGGYEFALRNPHNFTSESGSSQLYVTYEKTGNEVSIVYNFHYANSIVLDPWGAILRWILCGCYPLQLHALTNCEDDAGSGSVISSASSLNFSITPLLILLVLSAKKVKKNRRRKNEWN